MIFAIIALHLKVYSFDGVDDSFHLFPPFTLQSHKKVKLVSIV